MFKIDEIGGMVVPTFTIFNDDQTIDYEGTLSQIDFLLENGASSLFSLGTTQENASLTEGEYKKLTDAILTRVAGRVPVIVGVCSPATCISIEYAKFAEAAGADAVFAVGPYYMNITEKELCQFHRDIAASVKIPYMLYNNPGISKLGLSVEAIAELTKEGIVSLIKDTTQNPVRTQDFKRYCKEGTKVFFGDDYGAYQALIVGADGWTSGIANIVPAECRRLWDLIQERKYEEGEKLWQKLLPLYDITDSPYWLQIYKEGAALRTGNKCGMRKPSLAMPEEYRVKMKKIVKSFGY